MNYTHQMRVLRYFDRIKDACDGIAYKPLRAIIHATDLCNYACPWCESVNFRQATIASNRHTLETGTAKELLYDLVGLECKTAHFTGGGEPTLHPRFGELVTFAKVLGLKVALDTNGSRLDRWHEELLQIDNIRVSLNAANQKEYDVQTGERGRFERVLFAIRRITEQRQRPEVGLSFVVSDCNRNSVEEFEKIRKDVGADFLFVRDERGSVISGAKASKCYFAVTIPQIGANGDVQACCERRDIVFGNIYKNRFRDIWGSEEHTKIAKQIIPPLCQRCLCDNYNEAVEKFVVRDEARSWMV